MWASPTVLSGSAASAVAVGSREAVELDLEGEQVVPALEAVRDLGDEAVQVVTQGAVEMDVLLDDLDHRMKTRDAC